MQKDLFGIPSSEPAPVRKVGFLERHRYSFRMDQAFAVFILLLVAYVLVFSFGVETGKRYAMAELKAERAKRELMIHELSERVFARAQQEEYEIEKKPLQARTEPASPLSESRPPFDSSLQVPSPRVPAAADSEGGKTRRGGKYTIQVITFTSQKAAEEALKRFAQKGLRGFVIPAGKYLQVCVDSFESREKALESLRHLKMNGIAPPDAYVRLAA